MTKKYIIIFPWLDADYGVICLCIFFLYFLLSYTHVYVYILKDDCRAKIDGRDFAIDSTPGDRDCARMHMDAEKEEFDSEARGDNIGEIYPLVKISMYIFVSGWMGRISIVYVPIPIRPLLGCTNLWSSRKPFNSVS